MLGERADVATAERRCTLSCRVQSCRWSGSSFLPRFPSVIITLPSEIILICPPVSARPPSSLLPGNRERYAAAAAV